MKPLTYRRAGALCALIFTQAVASEERPPELDPALHPASPAYESIFPDAIVPLDAELSWTNRFLGNESFNAEESLPETSPGWKPRTGDKMTDPTAAAGLDATGIIKQIKVSEGKIKIRHEPIERLGMPAMTMLFRIEDVAQLSGLEKGSEVAFSVDNTSAGFSITRIEPVSRDRGLDARGTISAIRTEQGKVKIKHGPIDRLGMPAMTMMFKVRDPAMLEQVEKGMDVEFDVVNGPAGFEITRLRPAGGSANPDARGTVTTIRPQQGKIKIKHDPIDRLGMPAMTMMFKVRDLAMLEQVEKGMEVEFDVVNGPAGFEITRIKPAGDQDSTMQAMLAPQRLCYDIGPFAQRTRALDVSNRYRSNGAVSTLESRTEREYLGEMVYIESHDSRDAALATAEALAAQGISDTIVLNESGRRFALSLGIFSHKQNAARLKSQVEAMNFPVRTEARYRQRTVYWLHNEQSEATQVLTLLAADELAAGISQKQGQCKAGEGA